MIDAMIILASHGSLANGYKDTLGLLGVDTSNIICMNFYTDKGNNLEDIKKIIADYDEKKPMIIFTDIMYGSVNQIFIQEKINSKKKNIHIIAGCNLPVVMSICLETNELTEEKISELVNESKKQLIYETDFELKKIDKTNDDILN
jgi:mannose/fructose-specific phosphotransferase system component IIA